MRRSVSTLVACVLFALPLCVVSNLARATDYGDLWWVPAESGWGLQTGHQGDTMFLTLYVYNGNGQPMWFSGQGSATTPGGSTFTGKTFFTHGPFYGGPFSPPAVTREAGTFTFQGTSPTTATLTYLADGFTVTKLIERFPFPPVNASGAYIGSFLSVKHGCANPANNGLFNGSGQFTVVHSPPSPAITINAVLTDNLVAFTCTYQGTYSQLGRIASILGTYQCSSGQAGTWNANEIELSTLGGILGRYSGTNAAQGCQITGGFGGLKN